MAGMEALGRLCNVIPNITTNTKFKVRGASSIMVVVTGATAVVTLAQDSTFGGSFATAAAVIKNVYWATAADGTAAWNKLTYVNGTAPFGSGPLSTYTHGTTTGLTTAVMSVFHVFTSEFSDPMSYLKVTMTGSGIGQIFPCDLVHQRAPANLEILAS
jgi:hypothetical protein